MEWRQGTGKDGPWLGLPLGGKLTPPLPEAVDSEN